MADPQIAGPKTWNVALDWSREIDRYTASGLRYVPIEWSAIMARIATINRNETTPSPLAIALATPCSVHTLPPRTLPDASSPSPPSPPPPPSSPSPPFPSLPSLSDYWITIDNWRTRMNHQSIGASHNSTQCVSNYDTARDLINAYRLVITSMGAVARGFTLPAQRDKDVAVPDPTSVRAMVFMLGTCIDMSELHLDYAQFCCGERLRASLHQLFSTSAIPTAVATACLVGLARRIVQPNAISQWRTPEFTSRAAMIQKAHTTADPTVIAPAVVTWLRALCDTLTDPAYDALLNIPPSAWQPQPTHNSRALLPLLQSACTRAQIATTSTPTGAPTTPTASITSSQCYSTEANQRLIRLRQDDTTLFDAAIFAALVDATNRGVTLPQYFTRAPATVCCSYSSHSHASSSPSPSSSSHSACCSATLSPSLPSTSGSPLRTPCDFLIPYAPMTLHHTMVQFWNALRGCLWCAYCRAHHRNHWNGNPPTDAWFAGEDGAERVRSYPPTILETMDWSGTVAAVARAQSPSIALLSPPDDPYVDHLRRSTMARHTDGRSVTGTRLLSFGRTWQQWIHSKRTQLNASETPTAPSLESDKLARRQLVWTEFGSIYDLWDLLILCTLNLPVPSAEGIPAATTATSQSVENDAWHMNDSIRRILEQTRDSHDSIFETYMVKRGAWLLLLQTASTLSAYSPGYQSIVGYIWPPPLELGTLQSFWHPRRLGDWLLRMQWRWACAQDSQRAREGAPVMLGDCTGRLVSKLQPLFPQTLEQLVGVDGMLPAEPTRAYLDATTELYMAAFAAHTH